MIVIYIVLHRAGRHPFVNGVSGSFGPVVVLDVLQDVPGLAVQGLADAVER